jgi:hypothetical protein
MEDRLQPPFSVHGNADAYWVEDAAGRRFGYVYWREPVITGTGETRLSRRLAQKTVKFIARQATAWAERRET